MKKKGCVLWLLLVGFCSVYAAGPDTLVGVYYYPWYDDSSFHGGSPTGSTTVGYHLEPTQVQPALGWYDQDNASVISQHYDWARYAGIDFFVCSYWGMNADENDVIQDSMFNNPDRGDIKLCVFLEPRITPAHSTDPATEAEMTAEMNYLCDNYFDHPSYLYIDGKPVIFIYITRAMDNAEFELCINTFRTAAFNKGYDLYIAGDEVWGSPNISIDGPRVSQLDAITNYDVYGNNGANSYVTDSVLNTWQSRNAAWKSLADTYGTDFIPAISPGYNDRTVRLEANHPACSRKLNNESSEFGTLFTGMIDRLEPDVQMVMINSWNEWHEDTQIEPTTVAAPTNVDDSATGDTYTQGVYYEGYGMRYLDILNDYFVPHEIPVGVSASDENPPNETAAKAFDGSELTKWLDFSMKTNGISWIQYRYSGGTAATVFEYAITSANDAPARDPKDWNLLGSNDGGETWDILDSRAGVMFTSRFQRQVFSIAIPSAYNIYRLEITDLADFAAANSVQIAEIELNALCPVRADFDCDTKVNINDLSYLAGVWLTDDFRADIAQPADGIVNALDFSIVAQKWLTDGTVGYWMLDETAGTVASDNSVNGYDGALMNMDDSDWIAGKHGNALDFDGIDDYVEITDCSGLNPDTSDWSVAFWMQSDTPSQSTFIISKRSTVVPFIQYSVGLSSGDSHNWPAGRKITFLFRETSDIEKGGYTTAVVDSSGWTHVAVVLNRAAGTVYVYIDGVSVPVTLDHDGTLPTITNDAPLYIGGQPSALSRYDGLIDDVRIYDRALSEAEIAKIAQ